MIAELYFSNYFSWNPNLKADCPIFFILFLVQVPNMLLNRCWDIEMRVFILFDLTCKFVRTLAK